MIQFLSSYRLAIFYFFLFSINSLASVCVAAFEKVSFKEMSKEDWLVISCVIISNWTGVLLAFLNKASTQPLPKQQ